MTSRTILAHAVLPIVLVLFLVACDAQAPIPQLPLVRVDVQVTGDGTVTSSPNGIRCEPDCSDGFSSGSLVRLTASAAEGWTFEEWQGDCTGTTTTCELRTNRPKNVRATFTQGTPPPEDQRPTPPDDAEPDPSPEPSDPPADPGEGTEPPQEDPEEPPPADHEEEPGDETTDPEQPTPPEETPEPPADEGDDPQTGTEPAAVCTDPDAIVAIPDPAAERSIRESIPWTEGHHQRPESDRLTADRAITCSDMTYLHSFRSRNQNLQSIEGLQHAKNLMLVSIESEPLLDVRQLDGLDVEESIVIRHTEIEEIRDLRILAQDFVTITNTQLRDVTGSTFGAHFGVLLNDNNIETIDGALFGADWVRLDNNRIRDIRNATLGGMDVDLSHNQITHLTGTPHSGTGYLKLRFNRITSLEGLETLYSSILDLEYNLIDDLSPLLDAELDYLNTLNVENNCLDLSEGSETHAVLEELQRRNPNLTVRYEQQRLETNNCSFRNR